MTDDASGRKAPSRNSGELTRREFIRCSAGTCAAISLGSFSFACDGGGDSALPQYAIAPDVRTTLDRMLTFPASITPGLSMRQLCQVSEYDALGYGKWSFGSGLPSMPRTDIMGDGYRVPSSVRNTKLLNFFAFTDIHITDKEAPNQLIYLQQKEAAASNNTSIYSPVMMYTTHVLDAAIQTANALHKRNPFDFGISLGDTCNSTSYNELRWYIDVIDGKVITPSSGANVGANSIDYQRAYQAAGLDKSIPWYQALGNHDHFFLGSFPVDADPTLGFRAAYVADKVWDVADVLAPNFATFPVLFNMENFKNRPTYYAGVLDGSSHYGGIVKAGLATGPTFASGAPHVVADPKRRSLARAEWVQEFFNTSTTPVGHGFNLVDRGVAPASGFACYSFVPNKKFPVKVIVLDDTQSETDGSKDIHGHGYLDASRWAWLKSELAKGQASDQLMIIAAHIPIGVSSIGSETEWWGETSNIAPQEQNAVSLPELVRTLWNTPNLLMWIAGHRHSNTVKAFRSPDPATPQHGFWQVETSSLRDFPQQFRTFEIYLNSDYTISIVTTNVDPAVAEGTPAAASRKYAIAVQQIVQNNMTLNNPNVATVDLGGNKVPVPTMDPSRLQSDAPKTFDSTIQWANLNLPGQPAPVPVHGSYNGELFKQLTPRMVDVLKSMFPQRT